MYKFKEIIYFKDIIGKKIVDIRGHKPKKNQKYIDTEYILFDDEETVIELREQDYYTYHDCSFEAKEITIYRDKNYWKLIKNDEKFGDANI